MSVNVSRRSLVSLLGGIVTAPYLLTINNLKAGTYNAPIESYTANALPDNTTVDSDLANTVFPLSVASGDPSDTGIILWTRLNPTEFKPYEPLLFEIYADPKAELLLIQGQVDTQLVQFTDFTIKVDLSEQLQPATCYYYRFIYKGVSSRIGRCKTLPAVSQTVDKINFAVLTCQDYTNGYYNVYYELANIHEIDFILHLGDFIYESIGDKRFQTDKYTDRKIKLNHDYSVAMDLDDYRTIYRTYRQDPWLRQAMENHSWIITTDDHEIANDCYWDYQQDALGAPDHPYTNSPEFATNRLDYLRQLKLSAQQAWCEYTPTRIKLNPNTAHPHRYSQIYRQFQFGNLVNLFMLDTRTYRTAQPCGQGDVLERYLPIGCTNGTNQENTMFGSQQKDWLFSGLASSRCRWQVLGNQTFMGRLSATLLGQELAPFSVDGWDGYQAERQQLAELSQHYDIDNLVVLTGDLHASIASYLKVDYSKSLNWNWNNLAGVEFMTPAVTSAGLIEGASRLLKYKVKRPEVVKLLSEAAVRLNNPHIKRFNANDHGFATIEFGQSQCEWRVYKVDKEQRQSAGKQLTMKVTKYDGVPWLYS
ncbi:alkaline phosphatase D family protein [Spartinivicinus poritis]|uniref:Alkaline phosphatase D family protein n=1 Tax=Spartinivicinus poritis TaxID=2994640 RepID=A0ABT5UAD5_9GAMM|nr:alkaline phosphatase D family protein [Spartinivicinus sp. A2-2]MDE1463343.1 alkaline phosphatase D family protein [Spartinivicinus sp. A2-2]